MKKFFLWGFFISIVLIAGAMVALFIFLKSYPNQSGPVVEASKMPSEQIVPRESEAPTGHTKSFEIVLTSSIPKSANFSMDDIKPLFPKVTLLSVEGRSLQSVSPAYSTLPGNDGSSDWTLALHATHGLTEGLYSLRIQFFSTQEARPDFRLPQLDLRTWFKVTKEMAMAGGKIDLNKARLFKFTDIKGCPSGAPILSGNVVAAGFPAKSLGVGNRLQLVLLDTSAGIDLDTMAIKDQQGFKYVEFAPPGNRRSQIIGSAPITLSTEGFPFSIANPNLSPKMIFPLIVVCPIGESDSACANRALPMSASHLSIPGKMYGLIPKNFLVPACGDKGALLYLHDFSDASPQEKPGSALPEEVLFSRQQTFSSF